jgi:RNA-splicing ligase RtcB
MPDLHWGIGATVGSVIPTPGAIIPAAVGVDIGCGMMAVQTSLHANHRLENLHGICTAIEKAVPHGRTDIRGKITWSDAPAHLLECGQRCSASITWGRWAPGITSSRSALMRTENAGS